MKRAGLYVRVSDPKQEREGTSLETQEHAGRNHALNHSYDLVEGHFYREVHTGVELWERKELTRLRKAIRQHELDVVIVYAIDRLARDPVHLGVILTEAEHHGVEVVFVTEPLDNSPEGQLIRFVRGYAAKVEHEKIKERAMRGIRARAESGKPLPGSRPKYGYRWRDSDKSGWVLDPMTAPVVHQLFEDATQGIPLRTLATRLTEAGIPSPTGRQYWHQTTVHHILNEPAYCGKPAAFRWKNGKNEKFGERPLEDRIPLPADIAPIIIDPSTFDYVQERLTLNKQLASRRNQDPESALLRGGYAVCGVCGNNLIVNVNVRRPDGGTYMCHKQAGTAFGKHNIIMRVDALDAFVWEHVRKILEDPSIIAEELERLLAEDPTPSDVSAVDRAIAEVERKQRNLVANLSDLDAVSGQVIRRELATLSTRYTALQAEREALLDRQQAWEDARERMRDLQAACSRVTQKVETLSYQYRRLALEAYKVQAKVWPVGHEPRYEMTCRPFADAIVSTRAGGSVHNAALILRWTDRNQRERPDLRSS